LCEAFLDPATKIVTHFLNPAGMQFLELSFCVVFSPQIWQGDYMPFEADLGALMHSIP
jgi:hypothetical protein